MVSVHLLPVFLLGVCGSLVSAQTLNQQSCDATKYQATIQSGADAVIGGILSMHDVGTMGYGCGTVTEDIQSFEAIRWALELLNKKDQFLNGQYLNNTYVPGITIGMVVRDYCSKAEAAVSGAEKLYPRFGTDRLSCTQTSSGLTLGVIGTSDSDSSKDIASLPFNLPIISFMASAPELSSATKYPSFMRTFPPDGPLMDVIIDTMKTLQWTYVTIIYTENSQGRESLDEIQPRLINAGICLTSAISTSASDTRPVRIEATLDRLLRTEAAGVVFFGTSKVAYALLERSATSKYSQAMGKIQWIFTDSISLSKSFGTNIYQRGILSIVPTSRFIVEFEDYWVRINELTPSSEDPWFQEWFAKENKCSFPNVPNDNTLYLNVPCSNMLKTEDEKRNAFIQDRFVEPAVHAVFAYAVALGKAQEAVCRGPEAGTACSALRAMTTEKFLEDYLKKVDFTYTTKERVPSLASEHYAPYNAPARVQFDENGDIKNPAYDVWNYNDAPTGSDDPGFKFRRVGTWINGRLDMNLQNVRMYNINRIDALPSLPSAPCPSSGCEICMGMPPPDTYYYKHGHVILTGVFSIHNAGDKELSCGSLDLNARAGIQYLESFIYALRQVPIKYKSPTSQFLRNVDLGGFGFDDCKSGDRARNMISKVQRGSLNVKDPQGNKLNPHEMDVYTAAQTSGLTIPIADLMSDLKRPILGYASTTYVLDNVMKYPYFLRMHPGINEEMGALINILKKFEWNYVQAIYIEGNTFSISGNTIFRKMATEHGICVVANHVYDENIVSKLRSQAQVKPVVFVAHESAFREYLEYVKNANASGEFTLLASSTFGKKKKIVQDLEDAADGTISVKWRVPDMTFFRNHLSALTVNDNKENPWFLEWYENLFNCFIDTNQFGKPTVCTSGTMPVTSAKEFELTEEATFVIDAVYATAHGLHKTLLEYCGPNYDGICGNFTNSGQRGLRLLENIRSSRFEIEGSTTNPIETFSFLGNEGNIFVDVYNFQKARGDYLMVGEFNPETYGYTDIPGTSILLYNGTSPTMYKPVCPGSCVECLYIFQGMKYQFIPGDIIIPAIFDVHFGGMNQFSCGKMRVTNGFQYTEAFAYALDMINRNNYIDGVKLGGLLLDGCSDSRRATSLLNSIHNGMLKLQDKNLMDISTRKFQSWLTYESKSTIDVADILAKIRMPLVSPAATAPLLGDKSRFSTFFRTFKSDMHVATAMARLTRLLGFNFVITLNFPDLGCRQSRDEFRRLAQEAGVCTVASYEFVTDGTVDIIMKLINQSTTDVVVVFAEPDMHIQELLEHRRTRYPRSKVIFIANNRWELPDDLANTVRNSITFNFDSPDLKAFTEHLATKVPTRSNPNPWFKEYYETKYSCNLPGTFIYNYDCSQNFNDVTASNFVQDLFVLSTINAVYSIAEGVKRTLNEKCGGVPGVCANFLSSNDAYQRIMDHMDAMSFTDLNGDLFKFIEREADRGYMVKRFTANGIQQDIGSYNENLTLSDITLLRVQYNNVTSACDSECLVCKESATNFADFTYDGDDDVLFNFVGLFDVHHKGTTPFTCGDLNRKHGFELLEAFHYAVDYVNSHQGIFRNMLTGVRIGAIGLDTCQSPIRAANLVANIHSGNIKLIKNGRTLLPEEFDVYIGPFDSTSAIHVADVLSVLSIPEVSYGATSLELRDPGKYRYFLRTVPADDKQARAIISYLKRFKIDNVQVISTFDSVGQKGKEEFLRLAHLNRICVSQDITIGKSGPVLQLEATQTLKKIANNTRARVVILFVDDPRPITQEAEIDENIYQKYFFIGTDKWGMDLDMLAGLKRLIDGRKAVTFDVETADLPGFDEYLANLMPDNYNRNPWFEDYFEEVNRCYINTKTNELTRRCTSADLGIPRSPTYIQDPYVLYVVNAVFSAAIGLHYAIADVCETENYDGACNLFITHGERRQKIFQYMKSRARFTDATRQPFYFTPGGESDRGYHIYEPVPNDIGQPEFVYDNIGSYNDTHYLKLFIEYEVSEDSNCAGDVCKCDFGTNEPSRYMLKPSEYNLNLVYVSEIHKPHPNDMDRCGVINTDRRFQNLMAFFYAIESVNNNTDRRFPLSLKLGGLALDTCGQPYKLGQDMYSLLSGEGFCGLKQQGQVIPPATITAFIADTTDTALPISSMLSPRRITTISHSATSVDLSNKQYHPYFLRTVPPDNVQAIVMVRIMRDFNWDYATVVYSNTPYGIAAKNTLLGQANTADSTACISAIQKMDLGASLSDAEVIIDDLSQQVGSRVIMLFTTPEHSRLLLQATRTKGLIGRFIWLASDYWSNNRYIVEGYEEEARGAVTIQIRSEIVTAFTSFMKSLTLTNRRGIPDDWFEELYQTIHKCRLLSARTEMDFPIICTGNEMITDDMIPQDPSVLHTIISVYMVAQGLNNLAPCRLLPQLEVSACLDLQNDKRRDLIYNSILKSQLSVLPDELGNRTFSFSFSDEGYGDIGYNILNYHRDEGLAQYVYTKIGSYQDTLVIDRTKYSGASILESGVIPISQCPSGIRCSCLNADGLTTHIYRRQTATSSSYSSAIYIMGEDGYYYNSLTGQLVDASKVPSVTGRFMDIWAIIVATIAGFGCFVAVCMFIYLLAVYPNRGGTSILGFILCFGIILMYALVFAFIAHANVEICGLRRFALGLVYAICYGALFVKLIDCWRTQDKVDIDNIKYNKLGRPCGLFLVVVLLVLVQVIINAEWLILQPPEFVRILYKNQLWPRCSPGDFYDESLVLSLVYIMVLIVLSVILGFMTFRKSKNHYESRWILGIAVLSIPCWVIWCLVASIGAFKVRDAAVAIGLLVNATFMLLLGPLRKLYLLNKYQTLIEEDEREYRASVAAHKDYHATYGRQYDNVGRLHEGSVRGSAYGGGYITTSSSHRYVASSQMGTQRSTGSAYNPYSDIVVQREETQIQ